MKIANDDSSEHAGYVDTKFIAKYLGFRVSTIRGWVKRKKIPFYSFGKGFRFIVKEVDEAIRKQKEE